MPKTKILIADDHRVVIDGIKRVLSDHPGFEVVGEALDGYQVIEQAKTLNPDITIIDISMPGLNGIDAAMQIRKLCPDIRIIILTMYLNKEYVIDLFRAGISAYVMKEDPTSDLIFAIKAVKGGGTYFSGKASAMLIRHIKELEKVDKDDLQNLSLRERETFCLLAKGNSVREIAGRLCVSPKTVGTHKHNVMFKLKARTMTDLVKIAIKKKLIQL